MPSLQRPAHHQPPWSAPAVPPRPPESPGHRRGAGSNSPSRPKSPRPRRQSSTCFGRNRVNKPQARGWTNNVSRPRINYMSAHTDLAEHAADAEMRVSWPRMSSWSARRRTAVLARRRYPMTQPPAGITVGLVSPGGEVRASDRVRDGAPAGVWAGSSGVAGQGASRRGHLDGLRPAGGPGPLSTNHRRESDSARRVSPGPVRVRVYARLPRISKRLQDSGGPRPARAATG